MGARSRNEPGRLSIALAAILSEAFDDSGKTQAEVAEAAGMSQSQLSKYLRAVRTLTADELDDLCAALGLSLVDVVTRADAARRRAP